MSWTGRFTQGPNKGMEPSEVSDEYLKELYTGSLSRAPEGHPANEVWTAVKDELLARCAARGEPMPELTPAVAPNPSVFSAGQPISAYEARRRSLAFEAKQREAEGVRNGHGTAPAGAGRAEARAALTEAIMPCGHPTADLRLTQGRWRAACRGCERLTLAFERISACKDGQGMRDILLAFEAEIRGYKAGEDEE